MFWLWIINTIASVAVGYCYCWHRTNDRVRMYQRLHDADQQLIVNVSRQVFVGRRGRT